MCFAAALTALGAGLGGGAAAAGTGAAVAGGAAATGAAGASGILGTLGTVATVGSGVIGAISQYTNAKAQADAAAQTAAFQDEQARERLEQAEEEAVLRQRAGAAQIAKNQAAMAANGIDLSGDFAIDQLATDRLILEEDVLAIRENGRRSAQAGFQQSANSRAQADGFSRDAIFKPVGTILTTAAKVGNRYASTFGQQAAGAY